MSALTFWQIVAAVFFALWVIEHVAGRQVRDELRARLVIVTKERDEVRRMVHPPARHWLRVVRGAFDD